jgi:hypothetical protein
MPGPDPLTTYTPSPKAVEILCERLQRMGVAMSEPAARLILEAILAVEGPRLHARAQTNLQSSLETIRRAAETALGALTGSPGVPRRDYQLSLPTQGETSPVSGKQRRVSGQRPAIQRHHDDEGDEGEEPRPVFKRRRGR